MEVAMEKGIQSYLGLVFGMEHKSAWLMYKSAQPRHKSVRPRNKSAWAGAQVIQPSFQMPLLSNVRESYVSHLPLSYGIGTRAFWGIQLLMRSICNAKIVCIMPL